MTDSLLPRPQRIVTLTPNPVLDRTLTVPEVLLDTVLRATEVRFDAGGKGFNVSRALMALGVETLAVALVGGATGRTLEQMLHEQGVATRFVQVHDETRTNIVVTEADGARHLKVNEAGPLVLPAELAAFEAAIEEEARPGDLWVLAGSLPRGMPAAFYAEAIERLRRRGALAALDASGDALRLGLAAQPFLAKPNHLELAEATGLPLASLDEIVEAARAVVRGGVAVAAVSLGADGLLVATDEGAWHARPPAITARNTVGAGDATVAGIVWALLQGETPAGLARWGAASGTAAAARAGVTFGAADDVRRMADLVDVQRVRVHS